ncbi:MAG: amino acid permease [Bryobacteraceae bacterium]|nr:amino acid permease [Bryobacteraceae bacterium]
MQHELRRDLGLWGAVSIVIGTVIGSGIFLVPKRAILKVGDTPELFFVWVFGGLLSLAGALTYAELAAAIPESGGEYAFLRKAYGRLWAFVYGWTQLLVAKSGSVATLATAFYLALSNFVPELKATFYRIDAPIGPGGGPLEITYGQLLAIVLILALAVVNFFGVRFGGGVQIAVTIAKVGLIGGVTVIGLAWSGGSVSNFSTEIAPDPGGLAGFFAALVGILWAYDGWNNVSMVSAEIKDPQKNLPRALIYGTAAVMAIYLAANAAYFYVLSAQEVSQADIVPTELMRKIFGAKGAAAVSIVAMVSIFAALNGSILSGARVPFAMARDGLFFRAVGDVHPRYGTPSISTFLLAGWSCLLLLSGRYDELYTCVIFASWILYGMATASVFVLRRKFPEMERPYRTLGYPLVPALFVLVAGLLIFYTLRDSPRESILGLVLIAIGLPFYFHWNRPARKP